MEEYVQEMAFSLSEMCGCDLEIAMQYIQTYGDVETGRRKAFRIIMVSALHILREVTRWNHCTDVLVVELLSNLPISR